MGGCQNKNWCGQDDSWPSQNDNLFDKTTIHLTKQQSVWQNDNPFVKTTKVKKRVAKTTIFFKLRLSLINAEQLYRYLTADRDLVPEPVSVRAVSVELHLFYPWS